MHAVRMPAEILSPERRVGARQRTLFAIGKLTVGGRHRVCIVRNLSEQGVGIDLADPPAPGTRVTIEARSLVATQATVIWSRDGAAGLQLDVPAAAPTPGLRPRSPRFALVRPATLIVEGRLSDVPLRDIGLGGAQLGCHVPSRIETLVVLLLGPYSLAGRICWQAAGMTGIRFARPMSPVDLSALLDWADRPGS